MSEAPVAKPKSVLDQVAAAAFSRRSRYTGTESSRSIEGLEEERKKLQEEISKLTMIISDDSIPLNDDEVMEINDEISSLLLDKHQVEKDIFRFSGGQINYVLNKAAPNKVYFGRAKSLNDRLIEESQHAKRLRSVSPSAIKESKSKEECVQETILKSHGTAISSKPKKTRFDDDEDDD